MKKGIIYFIIGVGIGSFLYIINLLIYQFEPSVQNALITWVCSGLMGLVSLIYEKTKWSEMLKISVHMLSIYLLVMTMLLINQWIPFQIGYLLGVSFEFMIIYLIIAAFFIWESKERVSEINKKLNERK